VPAKQKGLRSAHGLFRKKVLWEGMQQPQLTTYADIAEVRTVTGAAVCDQLLADGWVLLGIFPLTTVGAPAPGIPLGRRLALHRETFGNGSGSRSFSLDRGYFSVTVCRAVTHPDMG
jgi:hypothetical protein